MNKQSNVNSMDGKCRRVPTRTIPRNTDDQIYCDHQDCQPMPPTFGRPCDWNKHMDKHDCPFRCHEPGCTREKGFTDSGGLLHHQREVHQKYTNARMPIMCPYADCGRSSGNGFTRRENLREHLRRRHQHADDFGRNNRLHDATKDLSEANDGGNIRKEFTQLYREVQVYDRRLEELECKVAVLQSAIARSS